MHDRVAELAGLRAELATCENGPRTSRREKADEVRTEIERVRGELDAEAERLEDRAAKLSGAGQDIPAAQAAIAAREIRAVLDEDEPAVTARRGTGGKRTAPPGPPRTDPA